MAATAGGGGSPVCFMCVMFINKHQSVEMGTSAGAACVCVSISSVLAAYTLNTHTHTSNLFRQSIMCLNECVPHESFHRPAKSAKLAEPRTQLGFGFVSSTRRLYQCADRQSQASARCLPTNPHTSATSRTMHKHEYKKPISTHEI